MIAMKTLTRIEKKDQDRINTSVMDGDSPTYMERAMERDNRNGGDNERIDNSIHLLQELLNKLYLRGMMSSFDRQLRRYNYGHAIITSPLFAQYIEFGNVHRFGRIVGGKSRPIVARFIYNKDREGVLRCARRLKGSTFYINEQFPTEIQQRRRELGPTVRDLRGKGKNVRLVRDKLIVDGRLYDGPIIKQSSVKERRSPTSVDTNSGNSVPSYSAVTRVNTSATSPNGARGHNSRTGNPHSTASSRHDGH
ncbi:uncharacterized protein LOC110458221 [Mizuhopecten yessoensis]|uniref:uncharacterized protein LOC110458221 n=1 Tax=Mizuhopecten yessoensis TaxID=6573 RepID=UPI000B45D185|nr:uncharacterized protein LOC110458221 [Mizuhopecten yessoensis]